MAAYLISRAGEPTLDTVVFAAGPHDNEEAVAVFTDPTTARAYIESAGWDADYTVATLDAIPFLKWLLHAHQQGVRHLAVNPDYERQQRGERQTTLSIEAHLAHAGDHILQVADPDF
jgi:hypothetical protein